MPHSAADPAQQAFGVCLFCSASRNLGEQYLEHARAFGDRVGRAGFRLVYGGSTRGLMGAAAQAAHDAGAPVLGFIPDFLINREGINTSVGEMIVVQTLAERKARMAEAADAFVAIPGGIGTLDEITEMVTWNELGVHTKPVYLVNTFGFWDPIVEFFRRGREIGVIRPGFERHCRVVADLDELFAQLTAK